MTKTNRGLYGGLDKYYTRPEMAYSLAKSIPAQKYDDILWIEPAAGSGVFVDALSSVDGKFLSLDIKPDNDKIIEMDWLKTKRGIIGDHTGDIIVYGNPPFGFGANLAVKFFNHAAREFEADVIAFILPKTFAKDSIVNRLDRHMHLSYQSIFDKDESVFYVDGNLKYIPCLWQIWERSECLRKIVSVDVKMNPYVTFTKHDEPHDLIMRRVGGRAGQILPDGKYSPSSTLFIQTKQSWVKEALLRADFSALRDMTAGVRSVSKKEVVQYLMDYASGD